MNDSNNGSICFLISFRWNILISAIMLDNMSNEQLFTNISIHQCYLSQKEKRNCWVDERSRIQWLIFINVLFIYLFYFKAKWLWMNKMFEITWQMNGWNGICQRLVHIFNWLVCKSCQICSLIENCEEFGWSNNNYNNSVP
jgi:hypothetical protein